MATDFVTCGSYIKIVFEEDTYKGVIISIISRENDNVFCDIKYDVAEEDLPFPEKHKILLTNYDFLNKSDKHWEFVDQDFQLIVTKMVNMTEKLDKMDEQLQQALVEHEDEELESEEEEGEDESEDEPLEKEELSLVDPTKKSSPVPIILAVFLGWSLLRLFYKPVNYAHEYSINS